MRSLQRAFTLLEVLIVMIIIGVMIGASTIMLKRDHQDLIRDDADRLRALITLGRDEAVFQARSLGIYFTGRDYTFMRRAEDQKSWSPMADKQFRKRTLGQGVKLSLSRNNTQIQLLDEKIKLPQVFLLSTGEVTPFAIELTYPAKAKLELTVDGLGQTEVVSTEVF